MDRLNEAAAAVLAALPRPTIIATRLGPVECAVAGEGPAVLALHGGMGGYDQGLLLAQSALSGPHMVVAPSRPGYLGTPLTLAPTPAEQADLFAAVLDAHGLSEALVIAVSGGGPSALAFALRHRARCRGVVMVSAVSGRFDFRLPWRFHLLKFMARWPALATRLGRRALRDPAAAMARAVADPDARARLLADPVAAALFAALQASLMDGLGRRLPGTENDTALFQAFAGYPLEDITVPLLAVHGDADRVVAFSHAEALAARVPGAELERIAGGEHVCLFTHLGAVRARVSRFLAGRVAPSSSAGNCA